MLMTIYDKCVVTKTSRPKSFINNLIYFVAAQWMSKCLLLGKRQTKGNCVVERFSINLFQWKLAEEVTKIRTPSL